MTLIGGEKAGGVREKGEEKEERDRRRGRRAREIACLFCALITDVGKAAQQVLLGGIYCA